MIYEYDNGLMIYLFDDVGFQIALGVFKGKSKLRFQQTSKAKLR